MKKSILSFLFFGLITTVAFAGTPIKDKPIKTGADQTNQYLSYLKGIGCRHYFFEDGYKTTPVWSGNAANSMKVVTRTCKPAVGCL